MPFAHPMQAAPTTHPDAPCDSASLVLLQDSAHGPQVLLLRRNAKASNMAGVFVFPGGKLDAQDHWADGAPALAEPHERMVARLAEDSTPAHTAAALYVAALREALEECGLLLAEPRLPGHAVDAAQARERLRGGQAFGAMLDALGLRLQTQALRPWSRWITPLAPPPGMVQRRFDTRFFVARAPADQVARHDDGETVETLWLAPRAALEQYRDGAIELVPPQIMTLAHLARFASVADVLHAASNQRPPVILPQTFVQGDARVMCYPGDACHAVTARALPGPTRLQWKDRKFLPENGFDALFD